MQTILVLGLGLLVTFARIDVDSQMETSFHWRALHPDASAGLLDRNLQHFGELRIAGVKRQRLLLPRTRYRDEIDSLRPRA
jgi:hypothetical protein